MPTQRREHERLTLLYALALAGIAVLYRLAPYYLFAGQQERAYVWNLMPVGGLALFVGARLRPHLALLFPLAVMLLSDLLLIEPIHRLTDGKYSAMGWGRLVVYASFTVYVLLGWLAVQRRLPAVWLLLAAWLGGAQFFLVTNFAEWLTNPIYPRTIAGLSSCYAFALPFYRNTLLADFAFTGLFFAAHAALVYRADWRKARQPA